MKSLEVEKQQVLYLIRSDPNYKRYFFVRVKSVDWFDALKRAGYFDPGTIDYDESGYAYFWDVLDYLERISEQLDKHPEMAEGLMKIIDNIVKYSQTQRKINNYHIWWYCVKILNNVPNDLIVKHLIGEGKSSHFEFKDWLSEWINKDSSSDLTISDISEKLLKKFLDDKHTIPLAEDIIDTITHIKRSEKKDYFSKKSEALLRWQPYWILKSLQQQASIYLLIRK